MAQKARQGPGRPRIKREVEQLIIRMASENRGWGFNRIAGALANLGCEISDQTVGNVLRRPRFAASAGAQAYDHVGRLHSDLNAYAERWVRSVKEECLSKVILFGERSLRRALSDYVDHFHAERNHQGKGNILLFPRATDRQREGPVSCRERMGGLLRYYHQEAA
jgi:hypothetical protein